MKPPSVWPYVVVGALAIAVIAGATFVAVLTAMSGGLGTAVACVIVSVAAVFVYQFAYKAYSDRWRRYEESTPRDQA